MTIGVGVPVGVGVAVAMLFGVGVGRGVAVGVGVAVPVGVGVGVGATIGVAVGTSDPLPLLLLPIATIDTNAIAPIATAGTMIATQLLEAKFTIVLCSPTTCVFDEATILMVVIMPAIPIAVRITKEFISK